MPTGSEEDDAAAVAEAIRREFSLGDGIERLAPSSIPVFAVGGEHVVKLFPSAQRSYFDTERAALECIEGLLQIPTPRAIGTGKRGPWSYLVMTRLPGCSLAEAWQTIEVHDRIRLMHEVGEALASLHAIATDVPAPLAVDWPGLMRAQRAACEGQPGARGLEPPWADGVGDFLARWAPEDGGQRALLHTEIMREHLLVERREGAWRISGLVDFEDAMVGAPKYEFACAGIFLTSAEPGLLRGLLDAYGAEVDDDLPMRLMAYALLHRYSNLRWYLKRLPVPSGVDDLESLARAWFTP